MHNKNSPIFAEFKIFIDQSVYPFPEPAKSLIAFPIEYCHSVVEIYKSG